ncbi:MAG: DnaA/Hda family protein, partial [bacterium]
LLHAIANYLEKHDPAKVIIYTNTEEFTSDLIDAIQNDTVNSFRARYKNADLLLLDDVQFLAGKERAQEEFFHIFNTLFQAKKQIVITSDRPPKDLALLEKRLRSRFGAGVIVDIQAPDQETRVAILRRELTGRSGVEVPDTTLRMIAERISSNIRELKGALNQVLAVSELNDEPVSDEMASLVLDGLLEKV